VRGAIILAGGTSRRMGRPKALVRFLDVPLVQWMVRTVRPVAPEVIVVARPSLARRLSHLPLEGEARIIRDRVRVRGPLAGLLAGAASVGGEYVAALACDLPLLQVPLLRALFREARGRDAAVPRWPGGRIEPLGAVYRRVPLLAAARASLRSGDWALQDVVARLRNPRFVDTDSLRPFDESLVSFTNVNTLEELERAERRYHEDVLRGSTSPRFASPPRTH